MFPKPLPKVNQKVNPKNGQKTVKTETCISEKIKIKRSRLIYYWGEDKLITQINEFNPIQQKFGN